MNDFDWSQYHGNLTWLPSRTIYVTRHGSHAYGTSLPTSDLDLRGVAIPPREYFMGWMHVFEQAAQNEPDLTIFDIRKFMNLAADCNPNVIEILYTDPSDHLLVTGAWRTLAEQRHLFLSQKAKHTFSGYAVAQLKRINTHYRWIKNPPKAAPTREEFGLPERTVIPGDQIAAAESAIRKQVDDWAWNELGGVDPGTRQAIKDDFARKLTEITQWAWQDTDANTYNAAAHKIGIDENFIRLLDLERRYTSKHREWTQYLNWKKTRNPARAVLEEKAGYDTKHGMHLVRLMRMCREILRDGAVNVRRHDADELLAIRAGTWSYESLVEWAEKQDAELTDLAKVSKLPKHADRVKLDALCIRIVEASFA